MMEPEEYEDHDYDNRDYYDTIVIVIENSDNE